MRTKEEGERMNETGEWILFAVKFLPPALILLLLFAIVAVVVLAVVFWAVDEAARHE